MASGAIAATLRGFAASAEKRDTIVRLSQKSQRTVACPTLEDLRRDATPSRQS
jgi:hypothetical protein